MKIGAINRRPALLASTDSNVRRFGNVYDSYGLGEKKFEDKKSVPRALFCDPRVLYVASVLG